MVRLYHILVTWPIYDVTVYLPYRGSRSWFIGTMAGAVYHGVVFGTPEVVALRPVHENSVHFVHKNRCNFDVHKNKRFVYVRLVSTNRIESWKCPFNMTVNLMQAGSTYDFKAVKSFHDRVNRGGWESPTLTDDVIRRTESRRRGSGSRDIPQPHYCVDVCAGLTGRVGVWD
jgi:hypothetical protein